MFECCPGLGVSWGLSGHRCHPLWLIVKKKLFERVYLSLKSYFLNEELGRRTSNFVSSTAVYLLENALGVENHMFAEHLVVS